MYVPFFNYEDTEKKLSINFNNISITPKNIDIKILIILSASNALTSAWFASPNSFSRKDTISYNHPFSFISFFHSILLSFSFMFFLLFLNFFLFNNLKTTQEIRCWPISILSQKMHPTKIKPAS